MTDSESNEPTAVKAEGSVEVVEAVEGGVKTELSTVDSVAHSVATSIAPSLATSRAVTPRASATPVPIELTKFEINQQRKNYFLEQQENLNKRKVSDSAKRFKYLIGLTDLFKHFIDARAKSDPEFKKLLKEVDVDVGDGKKENGNKNGTVTDHRHRKTEKEEDAELLIDEEQESDSTIFTESPGYIHGKMREYQVQGLNWMISLYENNISGILADEMGLGKTLQTVAFLGYLRYIKGIAGPHIVIVPKSTLDNWQREFARWTPEVSTLVLQGDKESRGALINEKLLTCDFDVCITSYEMVLREKGHLKKFAWEYIIIDEAHRIKNEESMLSQIIRLFNSRNRLLVTGTPLQNNLHELWALLNFILPDVFSDSQVFDEWFEGQGQGQKDDDNKDAVVKQLHKVLRPFLLRRIKSDVETSLLPKKEINLYLGMSDMQVKWYRKILEKDIEAVNGAIGKREGKTRLLNIVMQLRKCCNHPYLFEGAEPGPPYTTDEHLIFNCGKMVILDKLLKRAKEQGSRVLIFSQMSRMLDILEDYSLFRGYQYCRIDGSTAHEDRITGIDEYNKPGSEKFLFLLTTRAGGLGINLTTADIVVLYDSDWNPQADLQAMDRAHRIGQTKQVYVYRFVTENAIEEKVLERAAQKLRLDQLVIQQGRAQAASSLGGPNQQDLLSYVQFGAKDVFNRKIGNESGSNEGFDDDLDSILNKGQQRTRELNSKFSKLGLDELQRFNDDSSAYQWNGTDFSKVGNKPGLNAGSFWINPGKRERKENYSIDGYYKDVMNQAGKTKEEKPSKPQAPKAPKQLNIQDHQFYPPRLVDLQDKETSYYRKQIGYKVPIADGPEEDLEDREAERDLEQSEIDDSEPLTEEEIEEKQRLSQEGFSNWSKRDFHHFIQLNAKYGRDNISAIASEFEDKDEEEVGRYSDTFWRRYTEIEGYDRYIAQIEAGEEKALKVQHHKELLRQKVESYRAPLQQMEFPVSIGHGRKMYSEDEDRFLAVQLHRFGLDSENLYEMIRDAVRESPMFRFDWFFLSRTPMELSRRCTTILSSIAREYEEANSKKKRKVEATPSKSEPSAKKKKSNKKSKK